jgi:hypothetical protein
MDLRGLIRKLREERDKLDAVIASLDELQTIADNKKIVPKKRRGRKFMDEAGRQEVSERMKRYWAARRQNLGRATTAVESRPR